MKIPLLISLSTLLIALPTSGEAQFLVPGDNMMLDGIPSIPVAIADDAGRYGQYRSARFGNTSQVHRVAAPGASREQLTFFDEPVRSVSSYVSNGNADFAFYTVVMFAKGCLLD